MKRISKASLFALVCAIALARCGGGGGSPTTPSTPTPPAAATLSSLAVIGPSTPAKTGETAQFTATATMSNGTTQNVTSQATWQSLNTSVATVAAGGLVTPVGAGEAEIRATYQSAVGGARITVLQARYALSGIVRDETNGSALRDARVEVLDGANGGRRLATGSNGAYSFADLIAGTFDLRVSRSGYNTASRTITLHREAREDFALRRTSSPTPTPNPPSPPPSGNTCKASDIPANATCIGNGTPPVTAVCKDGKYSCSENRQGTCSSHGGVKCWVCPGKLCNGLMGTTEALNYSPVPLLATEQ